MGPQDEAARLSQDWPVALISLWSYSRQPCEITKPWGIIYSIIDILQCEYLVANVDRDT